MTGRGHRMTGVGAAFFAATLAPILHLPLMVAAAIAAASTTLPDWAELPVYRHGKREGSLIPHRTLTHWPPLWIGVAVLAYHEGDFPGAILLGIAIGAITHILGDAPNPMGIPWLLPSQRLRIGKRGWWKSGEHELFMSLCFGTMGFVLWRLAGG